MRVGRAALASSAYVALTIVLASGCGGRNSLIGADWANPRLAKPTGVRAAVISAKATAQMIAARWALPNAPKPKIGQPIESNFISWSAWVNSPGTSVGLTAFLTTRHTIDAKPTSAAAIQITSIAAPQFATAEDRKLWIADHRPKLGLGRAGSEQLTVPAGQYSFLMQGSILTYREAAAIPGNPAALLAVVTRHLRPQYGPHPPPGVLLNQLGALLATADLTNPARSAAWRAMASLPGLRICRPGNAIRIGSSTTSRYTSLCVNSAGEQNIVVVDPDFGTIRAVAERLLRPSALYPHVPAGTAVYISIYAVGSV
jgi:hypothetical protein